MKQICLTILTLISLSVWGQQVRTIGKVYIDGRELEIIAHGGPPYFEFNEYDTTLTTAAKQYLDDFGRSHKDSLYTKRKFIIELTPGLTEKERKKDQDLGLKRLKIVMDYLERNYEIDKSEFRARYSETITNDGCVGFIVKEKDPKRTTRREKKKLKKEEDNYFKEQ
jgi:hypothetical protein